MAYAHHNAVPSAPRFFSTCNLAVPAGAFREAGGFDPTYRTAEDREFCARWLAGGRRLVPAAGAIVTHAATSNAGRFWRRHFEFGKGAYRFRSHYARTRDRRITLEPPGFYGRLVLAPFTRSSGLRAVAVSALIVLSQVASALGFASAWRAVHTSKGLTA